MVAQIAAVEAASTIRQLRRDLEQSEANCNAARRDASLLRLRNAELQDQVQLARASQGMLASNNKLESSAEQELRRQLDAALHEAQVLRETANGHTEGLMRQNQELTSRLRDNEANLRHAERRFQELDRATREQATSAEEAGLREHLTARVEKFARDLEMSLSINSNMKRDNERLQVELARTREHMKELEAELMTLRRARRSSGAGGGGSWGSKPLREIELQRQLNDLSKENLILKRAVDDPIFRSVHDRSRTEERPPSLPQELSSPRLDGLRGSSDSGYGDSYRYPASAFGRSRKHSVPDLRDTDLHPLYHSASGHF